MRPLPNASPPLVPVGGGASARMGAVVAVGVLLTVTWIGFSGRSAVPSSPIAPPAVAKSSAAPATRAAPPTPTAPAAARPVAYSPDDVFGVYAELGDSQFITILAEPEPGHLTGQLRVPIPPPATHGTFVFQQFSAPSAPGRPVHIADWPIRVEGLVAASGREYVIVDEAVPAQRAMLNGPRPVLRGFRVIVRAQSGVAFGRLTIDISIGPNQRLVVGDDGIFGWPPVASIPEPEPPPFAAPGPRPRPRFSDECRLEAPPPPSTSGPHDEANC